MQRERVVFVEVLMDLIDIVRQTLGQHYRVRSTADSETVYFEDESLVGFVAYLSSVDDIVTQWQARQSRFLEANARSLRDSRAKSWNAYSVYLTDAIPTPEEIAALIGIEEDFRSTRKIAGAALRTPSSVAEALYPLLGIQNWVVIHEGDPIERLRTRWSTTPGNIVDLILANAPAAAIVEALLHED